MHDLRLAPVLLIAGSLCACAAARPAGEVLPPALFADPGRIVDTVTAELLTPAQAAESMRDARIVYVAEQHDQATHHEVQEMVVRALLGAGVRPAIGLEMVEAPLQPVLDLWCEGRLTEAELLEALSWKESWGFDFGLYRPLFVLAREHNLPLLALNAPRALIRKLAREGVSGLTPDERSELPPLDSGNDAHRNYVRQALGTDAAHGHMSFDQLYLAQLARDEAMAIRAAALAIELGPGRPLVLLAGRGHIEYGLGIPLRAYRLSGLPYRIVLPVTRGHLSRYADWLRKLAYPEKRADIFWESSTDPHAPEPAGA